MTTIETKNQLFAEMNKIASTYSEANTKYDELADLCRSAGWRPSVFIEEYVSILRSAESEMAEKAEKEYIQKMYFKYGEIFVSKFGTNKLTVKDDYSSNGGAISRGANISMRKSVSRIEIIGTRIGALNQSLLDSVLTEWRKVKPNRDIVDLFDVVHDTTIEVNEFSLITKLQLKRELYIYLS